MLFALVKWTSGKEIGTYTIIQADWIRDVDVSAFDNKSEVPCVLDWRVPDKSKKLKPSATWPTYSAMLVRTSEKEDELRRHMRKLESSEAFNQAPSKRKAEMPMRFVSDSEEEPTRKKDKIIEVKAAKLLIQEASKQNSADIMKKLTSDSVNIKSNDEETIKDLKRQIVQLHASNLKLKNMVVDSVPEMMRLMSEVLERFERSSRNNSSAGTTRFSPTVTPTRVETFGEQLNSVSNYKSPQVVEDQPADSDKVPLYPGCRVMVSRSVITSALSATTATSMTRILLLGVFPMTTLLDSNLKGRHSTRGADQPQHKKLDEDKIEAIFEFCLKKFPSVTKGQLGVAVNAKLTELRGKAKKQDTGCSAKSRDIGGNSDIDSEQL